MIKKFLNMWKVEGMDFNNKSTSQQGTFRLLYGKQQVGELSYSDGKWSFHYTDEYKNNSSLTPIVDFPDKVKEYTSDELWPFFATRIPSINQPYQFKKLQKSQIDRTDTIGLLKVFGNETINNPYRLVFN